ncbi:unnamed protein product [Caretta caretta]
MLMSPAGAPPRDKGARLRCLGVIRLFGGEAAVVRQTCWPLRTPGRIQFILTGGGIGVADTVKRRSIIP